MGLCQLVPTELLLTLSPVRTNGFVMADVTTTDTPLGVVVVTQPHRGAWEKSVLAPVNAGSAASILKTLQRSKRADSGRKLNSLAGARLNHRIFGRDAGVLRDLIREKWAALQL